MIKLLDGKNFNSKVGRYDDEWENPIGYVGMGSDIEWCSRHIDAGKICYWCSCRSEFATWSLDWTWYYLTECGPFYSREFSHFKFHWRRYEGSAKRYSGRGLKKAQLKSLFKRGCREHKKCLCSSVVQRGFWVCPKCIEQMNKTCEVLRCHMHDLFMAPKEELKRELLIYRLSGII